MRVIISGYHGMGNLGDEAVLAALLQHLREIEPGIECTVLSGDPELTRGEYGVMAIPRTSPVAIVRGIMQTDVLISGGGSLLQDVTGPKSVPYYLGIIALARILGKPVSIYAQGIGPLNSGLSRRLVRRALSGASAITVRDQASADLLRDLGHSRPEPIIVADPAFALTPEPDASDPAHAADSITGERPTLLFCLRPWPGRDWHDGRDTEYAKCVVRSAKELGVRPVLLAFQPEVDLPMAMAVARTAAASGVDAEVVSCDMPPARVLAIISRSDMVVGMRLHSLIFAAAAAVPSVAIDYDPKVRALASRLSNPYVVAPDASGDELFSAVREAWEHRDVAKERLSRLAPELAREGRRAAGLAIAPVQGGSPVKAKVRDRGANRGRARLLGIDIDCVSMDEAVGRVVEMAKSGQGGHVVTLNPEMTLGADRDPELKKAIDTADLVVPDGIGVVLGLKMIGAAPRGRVAGIELAVNAMRAGASEGLSFFFIGAMPEVAQQAADKMRAEIPRLIIAGTHHGYFSSEEEPMVKEMISAARPDVVLVAMGAGKQEKWIMRSRDAVPGAVWIGVGGSFDVLSGNVKRAPLIFQRLGLEWLYRLISEPRRAKRMTALPVFMFAAFGEALFRHRRR